MHKMTDDDYKRNQESKFLVNKDSNFARKFANSDSRSYNNSSYSRKNTLDRRNNEYQSYQPRAFSQYSSQQRGQDRGFQRYPQSDNFRSQRGNDWGSSYSRRPQYQRSGNTNSQRSYSSHSSLLAMEERSTQQNLRLERELFEGNEVEKGINFGDYDSIPVEVSGRQVPPPIENFDDVDNVHPQLLWNISRSGYTKPTPVQKHAFAISVRGRDIMGVAQTGSGKTAAFLLPMVQTLLESGGGNKRFAENISPVAVVLTPTRELAMQIHQQARKFLYRTGMRSVVVYGGVSYSQQHRDVRDGVDILVATPGRLMDFLNRGHLRMDMVRFLVLDEADRMLDMGFEEQLRVVMSPGFGMPGAGNRQTMMFSATFPSDIQILAQNFLSDYVFVAVGVVGGASESVNQQFVYSDSDHKSSVLLDLLMAAENKLVLVFVQRKIIASKVEQFLNKNGIASMSIHGDKSQQDREFAMSNFRRGICKVLVATDVASRGLDIPNVSFVVNLDMTSNIDDYVHRIGRTGRIGNEGTAITVLCEQDNEKILEDLRNLLEQSNKEVPDWIHDLIYARKREKGFSSGFSPRGRKRGGRGRGRGGGSRARSRGF